MRQGLGRQLAISYVVSVVAVFAIAAVLIDNAARDGFLDELTGTSQAEARAVAVALFDQPTQPLTNDLAESLEARITVIDVDGSVLSDSEADPTTMENHNDRPEVVEARSTGSGDSIRFSSTVGTELLYVAVLDGDQVIRLAVPLVDVNERMLPVRLRAIFGTLMVTLAGLVVVSIATRRTSRTMQALTESVSQVAAGKSPAEALDDPRLERTTDVAILSGAVRSMAGEIDERLSDLQSEQHLRDHLLDSLAEGVLLIRNTTVAYANPSARLMLGTALDGSTLRHHQISELAANQEGPIRMTSTLR